MSKRAASLSIVIIGALGCRNVPPMEGKETHPATCSTATPTSFRQKERAKAMAVHGALLHPRGIGEKAGRKTLFLTEDKLQRARDHTTITAATGLIPPGHERQAGQAGDRDVAPIQVGTERPILMLI